MSSTRGIPDGSLKQLAAQKEQEWKELQELRLQTLEGAYKDKDKSYTELESKFNQLKDDFKYNLKLIEERDAELERYDGVSSEMKAVVNNKIAEISELHIKIDELKGAKQREEKSKEQLQLHYQQRLREKQTNYDKYKSEKDMELKTERDGLEHFKRNLERQVRELEDELDVQKRELTTEFDEAMRKREHEFRVHADEMSNQVLAHELKAKLLSKELEILKTTAERTSQEFQNVDDNHKQLEKKLKEKDWELNDCKAMAEARITELESKLKQTEISMRRQQEEFERKYQEKDKYGREKEMILSKTKESHNEQLRQLQDSIRDEQSKLESANAEIRQLKWNNDDLAKDKEMQIERLQEDLNDIKCKWDVQIKESSRETVAKDLEVEALKVNDEALKSELVQRRHDIERYKNDLSLAAEREAALERSKAQLELDWQRRYDNTERTQYEKSEDLIRNLTEGRDMAIADKREKEKELKHVIRLNKILTSDRDKAMATLKQHGLAIDQNIKTSSPKSESHSEQIEILQNQNESLRAVIGQMRQEMEHLGQHVSSSKTGNKNGKEQPTVTGDYVKMLETEVKDLKKKLRQLESSKKEDVIVDQPKASDDVVMASVRDNSLVRNHIESLNNTIASLRSEKVDLSAQVKKHQARIQHFQNLVDQLSKQPRQKQVEVDQLQYEISAADRRYQTEIASLRQRVVDLDLQLIETRKEADEYYKGNLERNMEAVALGNELSALKMDMARNAPSINYGAQELVIQQLQDEVTRLRQGHRGHATGQHHIGDGKASANIAEMQAKLKNAARHISQLARDKQQLIQVGNRMRAELNKAGITFPSTSKPSPKLIPRVTSKPKSPQKLQLSEQVKNKLNQLEQLQYELTKQELKHVQMPHEPPSDIILEQSSSDTPTPDEGLSGTRQSTSLYSRHNNRQEIPERPFSVDLQTDSPELQRPHSAVTMSSIGGESLNEIWRMLDEGQTPHLFSPSPKVTRGMKTGNNIGSTQGTI